MLETNEYFNGKVKSIGFQTGTLPATVGVMEIGEYEFDTAKKETVTIISGALTVKFPEENDWHTFNENEFFIVDADKTFHLKVDVATAYLCLYE